MTQILIKTFIFFCYKTPVEIFVFDPKSKKFLNDLNGFYERLNVLNVLNVYVCPVGKNFVTKRIFKMWQNSFLPILEFLPISRHYFNFCKPKCDKTFYILWPSVPPITCNRHALKPTYFGAYIEAEFVTKLSKKVRNL